jgi:tRNA nucleotidyltransferase (CCA-adding enzyme)
VNLSDIAPDVREIANAVKRAGGRAFLVGGFVRDFLMDRQTKDYDLEVYGVEPEALRQLLQAFGSVNEVGRSFSVFKVGEIDVAIPRTDQKVRPGHRGFEVVGDPNLSFEKATARRDFTVNAILLDPLDGAIIDPFHGQRDIDSRQLRHVSGAFIEDPLRFLRGVQMVARFDLAVAPETLALYQSMAHTVSELPMERLIEELRKHLVLAPKPSKGFEFARQTPILEIVYPELVAMINCTQGERFHAEGDVWTHTMMVLDAGVGYQTGDPVVDFPIMLACLLHDVGKPATKDADGAFIGHDNVGKDIAATFLSRFTRNQTLIDTVCSYVGEHMHFWAMLGNVQNLRDATIRRARMRMDFQLQARVCFADHDGRIGEKSMTTEEARQNLRQLLARADALQVLDSRPRPLVNGRDLIARGWMKPGPDMGEKLGVLFEHQLDGEFHDLEGGLALFKKLFPEYCSDSTDS